MKQYKTDIKRLANLSKITLNEAEKITFEADMNEMIEFVSLLSKMEINTCISNTAVVSHTELRDDILANKQENINSKYFYIPKVFE